MRIKDTWKASKLRQVWHNLSAHKTYVRLCRLNKSDNWSMKYLLPGRLWLDTVDVVITTKCNLFCKGCHHLMPYYQQPYHMDKERLIATMQKLNECFDWCDHYNFLGGEPFMNPDLKYYIAEAPDEKCNVIQLTTNATIIPTDSELFEVMRRKKVRILLSQYPGNRETQQRLISILQ